MSDDIINQPAHPVHASTVVDTIQTNLQSAQRRKEAKERDDILRAERKRQKILIQAQRESPKDISRNDRTEDRMNAIKAGRDDRADTIIMGRDRPVIGKGALRIELPKGEVIITAPVRLVARHATEMPIPLAMVRIRISDTIEMKYLTIDGKTWRVTTRYDELVTRLNAAPAEVRVHLYKSATVPGTPPDQVVVPTGIFNVPAPKIPTP